MMPRADVAACLAATRRSLFALSVVPVWLASAVLFLWLWPWPAAVKHLSILGLLGALTAEVCLYGFHKVPFTCSYLPGKTRFNMAIMYMALFLIAAEWSADLEMRALDDSGRYALTLLVLIVAVAALRWRTNAFARSEEAALRFEEEPEPAVCALEIHKDGFVPLA